MVGKLASRSAGNRLLLVMGILAVPLLVLSYLAITQVRSDLTFAKNELAGVDLVEATMPLIFAATENIAASIDTTELQKVTNSALKTISNEDAANDLQEHSRELVEALNAAKVHSPETAALLIEHLHTIGSETGLVLDPFEETYFLAQSAVATLPAVLHNYYQLHIKFEDIRETKELSLTSFFNASGSIGALKYSIESVEDVIEHVFEDREESAAFKNFDKLIEKIKLDIDAYSDALASLQTETGDQRFSSLKQIEANNKTLSELNHTAMADITVRLRTLLTARANSLQNQFYVLILLCGACLIAATGSAYKLFSSTLSKLDSVEAAHEEAKRVTDQLTLANDNMIGLNNDLSANMKKLKNAQDELVKKGRMEQMGQLTATIAHELRNPLGAVRTSTFMLERKLKGSGLDVAVQFERINKGVIRCDNIITQLLDYSRTKKIIPKSANFDGWLINVVEEVAKILPANVELECKLNLGDAFADFDPTRMERAVINLLTNASEAFQVNAEQKSTLNDENKIQISTDHKDGYVELVVADNGPGISPENFARIRDPLFTTKNFGTGLGIPAIEQIATQHGGELLIESTLGKGACFTLRFPISAEQKLQEVA